MSGSLESAGSSGLAEGLGLIFDMDGVLIHSNPVHVRAWEIFNRRYGLETTPSMLRQMYGRRNDELIREFFPGLSPEEVDARGAAKEKLYRRIVAGCIEEILVPGIRPFLESNSHHPMGVASNAEPANVAFVLDRGGLRHYFRVVVDGHQVGHPKPHPEIYQRAAELLGIPPHDCVVFEDSLLGVQAARAAGSRVVGVLTTHDDLPGADLKIDNFSNGDLCEWLLVQKPAA
jgi:HAD superfamily hydrolase (TIGR01509 family)